MADYWSHLHLLQWRMKYNTGKTPWENGLNVLSVCSKSLCWGPYLGTCAGWTVWQHRFRDLIVWSALLSLQRTILLSLSLVVCMGRRRQKATKCSLSTCQDCYKVPICVFRVQTELVALLLFWIMLSFLEVTGKISNPSAHTHKNKACIIAVFLW